MTTAQPPVAPPAQKNEVALKDRGNLFEIATKQIEKAMKLINIDQDIAQILGQPKNELIVNFPVRRDNGRI
ncbi:MAG TPA: glutamate dehydrogenase, partial [Kofleriaceae bacterium]